MKTKILTTLILLISIGSFAQSPKTEHLTFKGVPIDGPVNEYTLKMKQNGFTLIEANAAVVILNGDFAGYKDCIVEVSTLKQTDLVHKISVIFMKRETWSELSSNYLNLKEMLTEKYGKPSSVVETFDYQPVDDRSRIYQVQSDRCKYYSIWQTDKGNIELSMSHERAKGCFVRLGYFDKTNGESVRAKAIDDL